MPVLAPASKNQGWRAEFFNPSRQTKRWPGRANDANLRCGGNVVIIFLRGPWLHRVSHAECRATHPSEKAAKNSAGKNGRMFVEPPENTSVSAKALSQSPEKASRLAVKATRLAPQTTRFRCRMSLFSRRTTRLIDPARSLMTIRLSLMSKPCD